MNRLKRFVAGSQLRARLANGMLWSLIGAVVSRSFTLLASIIVSRHLGVEQFGELGVLQSTVNMLGELAGLGVGIAATKFIAQYRGSDPGRAARILSLNLLMALLAGALMAVIACIFAAPLAQHLFGRESLAIMLKIGSVTLLLSTLTGALLGALAGFEAFDRVARVNVFAGFVSLLLQVAMVRSHGLEGVMLGMLFGQLTACLVGGVQLSKLLAENGMSLGLRNVRGELRNLYMFNLPALLASLMVLPVNWGCNLLLIQQEGGFVQMGLFNAANQWRMALLFIPMTLASVVLPMLASMLGNENAQDYRRILKFNLLANAVLSVTMILAVLLLSGPIMHMYGSEFESGEVVLNLLMIVAGLMAINNVVGQALSSLGELWIGVLFNFAWASVLMALAYWLIPQHGAKGLAFANCIAYGLHTIWQFVFLRMRVSSLAGKVA